MKKYFTKAFFKGLAKYFYDNVLYKYAKAYVEKTDNTYDDAALLFLDDLIKDLLKEDASA